MFDYPETLLYKSSLYKWKVLVHFHIFHYWSKRGTSQFADGTLNFSAQQTANLMKISHTGISRMVWQSPMWLMELSRLACDHESGFKNKMKQDSNCGFEISVVIQLRDQSYQQQVLKSRYSPGVERIPNTKRLLDKVLLSVKTLKFPLKVIRVHVRHLHLKDLIY